MSKKLSTFEQGKTCPLQLEEKFIPCEIKELEPIAEYLDNNITTNKTITFPKGTIIDGNRLDLCKQKIGPEGAEMITKALFKNNNIVSLMLGADGILNQGAIAVSELIKQNETIETVYLGCNLIDEQGVSALADSLSSNNKVKGLWLKRNPIGDKGIESIVEMLKVNTSIDSLDLVNTEFTLTGLKKLIKVLLEDNNSVNRIYLGGNHIDSAGAYEISNLIAKANIHALYLNVNSIGDEGTISLSKALRTNTTLKELGLASNNIGSTGTKYLFNSLMTHPSIKFLDLGYSPSTKVLDEKGNSIDDIAVEDICNFLHNNKSLVHLDLSHNCISDKGLEKIINSLENNHHILKFIVNVKKLETLKLRLREVLKRNSINSDLNILEHESKKAIKSVYRT